MRLTLVTLLLILGALSQNHSSAAVGLQRLTGTIVDKASGNALPARVYLRSDSGEWHFPRSAANDGSAIAYRKERQSGSLEQHTTLSAHPFVIDLPPGNYKLVVERGKEYHAAEQQITIADRPVEVRIPLERWINMAEAGWYSGDTHVHRTLEDLPNLLLAEDLNVALPLSYWVTRSHTAPTRGDKNSGANIRPEPIVVDATHVIYPLNTEYEIFTTNERRHTLGAVFVLGHKTPLEVGAPPVQPIAEHARREGALLDLDKHSWPWSLMLVPVMKVDLFELANNHVWRTQFGFKQWTIDALPPWLRDQTGADGFTEAGWIDFGFQTYYGLLNCGFRLRPTAGTASGVHPVPLGFGRVYVHLAEGFSYQAWMQGLNAGRTFVSTGPMLLVQLNDRDPGHTFANARDSDVFRLSGVAHSAAPLDRMEVVVNGSVEKVLSPANTATSTNSFASRIDTELPLHGGSWVAVRIFEKRPDGRVRFAHTAPWHIDVPGQPLRPQLRDVEYFIRRMREEIDRNRDVLKPEELQEYQQALQAYQALLPDVDDSGK